MKTLIVLLILIAQSPDPVYFRSGFQPAVVLKPPVRQDNEWSQYLTGADQGFDWATSLPQRAFPKNRITYLVSSRSTLSRYAEAKLQTVTGHTGSPTQALYMALKKQDPLSTMGTRVQYGIYPPASLTQSYVRYWLKLQPDLASIILPPNTKTSRQVVELKETGTPDADFRWGIYIRRDRGIPNLFWGVRAQLGDLGMSPNAWECTSTVPVPINQWFLLEVFWKQGLTDGRVWGAANGQVFVDYIGRTMKDTPVYVWWPFKIYVGTDMGTFKGNPIYQWVDDVEFASDPPVPPGAPKANTFNCAVEVSTK